MLVGRYVNLQIHSYSIVVCGIRDQVTSFDSEMSPTLYDEFSQG